MPPTSNWDTTRLVAADKRHVWHPFTPMAEWCAPDHQPLVLVAGQGAVLRDSEGREYIDGNSSIWTNLHGHNHPHINAAILRQLDLVAHTSFLGFTNPAAIELAEAIVGLFPAGTLSRVFFSDDGSTGMEAALRITEQYWRLKGEPRSEFVAFRGGYHGDTAGAASLGASRMFGAAPTGWNFPARQVSSVAELEAMTSESARQVGAVVIEPMIQGAAGMRIWPNGTLAAIRQWCDASGALLIADEVMTGFGRTGRMFACEHENVVPDVMVLSKGLTGGYLPLAVTLLTEEIFRRFSAGSSHDQTLFYGHSYTGNALGCAAAKASLEVFAQEHVLDNLAAKIAVLTTELQPLRDSPFVAEVRQLGFIAGIELKADSKIRDLPSAGQIGAAVCRAARGYGLLTRPILDTVVLMPPYCITAAQLKQAAAAIRRAIEDVYEPEVATVELANG